MEPRCRTPHLCVGSEHWAYLMLETQDLCLVESQDICSVVTQDMCCVESYVSLSQTETCLSQTEMSLSDRAICLSQTQSLRHRCANLRVQIPQQI